VVQQSGQSVCQGFETFTGTVNGLSGTVQFADVVFVDASGAAHGVFTIVGASDALANLRGHGTFSTVGGVGPYEGRLVFAR
jgi:Protein of unknown function (DUF3224)